MDANKPFENLYEDIKEIIPEILAKSRSNSGKASDLRENLLGNSGNNKNSNNVNNVKNDSNSSDDKNKLLKEDSNIIFVLGK